MINAKFYQKEIIEAFEKDSICEFIKAYVLPMFNTRCKDTTCKICSDHLVKWMKFEQEGFIKKGEPIWVKDNKTDHWVVRAFAGYDNYANVICYRYNTNQKVWYYHKFLTDEEKAMLSEQVPVDSYYSQWIKVKEKEEEPWKIRRFVEINNHLRTVVIENERHVSYAKSALLTDEDYYNMQLS